MPTPEWRWEKSERVVKSICGLLASEPKLPEEQRAFALRALHDALKLLCDAMQEHNPSRSDIWTPGVVKTFADRPEKCEELLALLRELDFKPDYYRKS